MRKPLRNEKKAKRGEAISLFVVTKLCMCCDIKTAF